MITLRVVIIFVGLILLPKESTNSKKQVISVGDIKLPKVPTITNNDYKTNEAQNVKDLLARKKREDEEAAELQLIAQTAEASRISNEQIKAEAAERLRLITPHPVTESSSRRRCVLGRQL
jgi:ABC-type proline/glycine betaine transport system substrate-binding protein